MTKNIEVKNDKNLSEHEVFKKIKEDLNPIQENLSEKKITVNEAKSELKKINEWIQWTKLENKEKKQIWKAFEKLIKLEENIDETSLKNEVNEIWDLLEKLTQKDLANLKYDIQQTKQRTNNRPPEVETWIKQSSKDLTETIDKASKDSNIIARTVGSWMQKLMS